MRKQIVIPENERNDFQDLNFKRFGNVGTTVGKVFCHPNNAPL